MDKLTKLESKIDNLDEKIDELTILNKIQTAELTYIVKEFKKVEDNTVRIKELEKIAAFAKGAVAFVAVAVSTIIALFKQ